MKDIVYIHGFIFTLFPHSRSSVQHNILDLLYSPPMQQLFMIHSVLPVSELLVRIRSGGMLIKCIPPKQPPSFGSENVWFKLQLRMRTKQALGNLLIISFDKWLTHAVVLAMCGVLRVAGEVCRCEYSRVGRRGILGRNSQRQSSLVLAGWLSLCSRRTGPAFAVEIHKGELQC